MVRKKYVIICFAWLIGLVIVPVSKDVFFFQVILGGPEQLQLSLILMDHIKKMVEG